MPSFNLYNAPSQKSPHYITFVMQYTVKNENVLVNFYNTFLDEPASSYCSDTQQPLTAVIHNS